MAGEGWRVEFSTMRPEQSVLLLIIAATALFGGLLFALGNLFDVFVVVVCGVIAAAVLPKRVADRSDSRDSK